MSHCDCSSPAHTPRLVVLTGGPGAGKTAVLEVIRRQFCKHVTVLPEAAGILFGGGFPRVRSYEGTRAAQRAIFAVQRELERFAIADSNAAVVLCDRGTLDGLAYWPGPHLDLLEAMHTSMQEQLARYASVIHLRTPSSANGYNHDNPLRIESAAEAATIDSRIAAVWGAHPHKTFIEPTASFVDKLKQALALVWDAVPPCCRPHLTHQGRTDLASII
jgi:predicted ATPase